MEFKKPNRYRDGRQTLAMPTRDKSTALPPAAKPPAQTFTPPIEPSSSQHAISKGASIQSIITSTVRRFLSRRRNVAIVAVAVVMVSITIVIASLNHQSANDHSSSPDKITSGTPDYSTLLPSGKTIADLGGWKRINPSNNAPVFAYTDTIDGVSVSVSQQPLPEAFAGNIDSQVADLAQKFNATTKLTAGNITAYIGTSAKGPQSVIFAKSDLLILIKSQKKIDNKSWEKYVSSLS